MVLVVKNLPANAGDARDASRIPGSERSPGEGHGNRIGELSETEDIKCTGLKLRRHFRKSWAEIQLCYRFLSEVKLYGICKP